MGTRPEMTRKISVEQSGKKKVSVDRAQVSKLGLAINMLVFGGAQPRDVVADIKQFKDKKRRGNIDIWWLYDDGGMPVLLSHILHSRQQFAECKLRVFTLGSEKLARQANMFSIFTRNIETNMETKHMKDVLTNFRISTSDITVISNMKVNAKPELWNEFRSSLKNLPKEVVNENDIEKEQEFINKHLRLSEELKKNSSDAQMIMLTLPQQYIGNTNPAIYMASLDFMTRNLPPTLLIGGNNISVLTSFT